MFIIHNTETMQHLKMFLFLSLIYVGGISAQSNLNIIDLARQLGGTSFLSFLDEVGATDLVRNSRDITMFLPSNDVIARISEGTLNGLRTNPNLAPFPEVIKFHITQGLHPLETLGDECVYPTLATSLPGGRFNIYNHTNAEDIKLYQGAPLVLTNSNHQASNGIIHILDSMVLLPPRVITTVMLAQTSQLSSFLALLQQTPEAFALLNSTANPHTLFAPNNAAIEKLDGATRGRLTTSPAYLRAVLLNHITQFGTYFTLGWLNGELVPTTNWAANLLITKQNDVNPARILVNDAVITEGNIATTTGVIHIIDTVLLPRNPDGSLVQVDQNGNIIPAGPVTNAPATTTPTTNVPATNAPATNAPTVTSAPVIITNAPATSAPVTTTPVTSSPATNAPVTSAPATGATTVSYSATVTPRPHNYG